MSTECSKSIGFCGLPGFATVALCLLLIGGQITSSTHVEIDCDDHVCAHCVTSTNSLGTLDSWPTSTPTNCQHQLQSLSPATWALNHTPGTTHIRGPPDLI